MEASSYGAGAGPAREADVAPAPGRAPAVEPTGGRTAGIWAPADPGPLATDLSGALKPADIVKVMRKAGSI